MSFLKRIIILTKMQAVGLFRKKKMFSTSRKIVKMIVTLATILLTAGAIIGLFYILKVFGINIVDYQLLCFIIVFIQLISIFSCTTGLMTSLYNSNDNQILLAFPAKHIEIFISKLLVYYYNEFIRNLAFLIPFLLAYGVYLKLGFGHYLATVVFTVLLPFIPVLIGAILSYPIMLLKRLFKNRNILQTITFIVLFSVVLYFYVRLLQGLPNPLQIIANFNRFSNEIKRFLGFIYNNSFIYKMVVDIFRGINVFENTAYILLLIIVLLTLVVIITMPVYFKLASHSREFSLKKVKKSTNKVCKNTFITFLRKEALINLRDFSKIMNDYVFLFVFPFIMFFTSYVFSSMNLRPMGSKVVVASTIIIGLMLTTASNTASATAITIEGAEFSLLKTAPGETKTMAWAKMTFNLVFSIIIISLNMLLLIMWTALSTKDLILTWLILVLVNSGHIFWSFELDIMHPKLVDYATNGTLTDSKNVSISIAIGFIISILFGALAGLLLIDDYVTGWIRLVLLALGFFLARLYLFSRKLKAYFMDIEF